MPVGEIGDVVELGGQLKLFFEGLRRLLDLAGLIGLAPGSHDLLPLRLQFDLPLGGELLGRAVGRGGPVTSG